MLVNTDRAIFLDRDGTLNVDNGYVHKIEDWRWLPDVLPALNRLQRAGWLLIVISNQSGIARGYFDWQDLENLEKFCERELKRYGVEIAKWYYCPHLPEDQCECRKPLPGMLFKAIREFQLIPAFCWMIGDKWRDIEAGIRAGCKSIFLSGKKDCKLAKLCKEFNVHQCENLAHAATYILKNS